MSFVVSRTFEGNSKLDKYEIKFLWKYAQGRLGLKFGEVEF
jgi:hypothetical protein